MPYSLMPHAYEPPDRAEWQARTGQKPYPLATVTTVDPKFVARAKAAVEREAADPNRAHQALDDLGQRLITQAGLPSTSTVVFDRADDTFWVYPTTPFLRS